MPVRQMVQKLQPTAYVDVAQRVLFAKDRNPDVIPDPPKPPPPPPPVPPFPVAHGVMILGDVPPTIILSANSKAEQQAYRAGDKVGQFEIASIDDRQVVFTWDGKTFVKNISDLEAADTTPANEQQTPNAPPPVQNTPPPPVAPTPAQVVSTQSGPLGGRISCRMANEIVRAERSESGWSGGGRIPQSCIGQSACAQRALSPVAVGELGTEKKEENA